MALKVGELFASLRLDDSAFNRGMDTSRNRFSSMGGALVGLAGKMAIAAGGAFSAALVAKTGVGYNAMMEQSGVAWETILGDAKKAQDTIKMLQTMGAATPFEFEGLDKAAKTLTLAGFGGKDLEKTLTRVGDAVSAVGGGQSELEGVSMALFQMSAKGKVSAEEMNQMAERGLPVWDMLAKSMGKSVPELMKMSSEGKLLANDALPALVQGFDRFKGSMDKQSTTFNGMMSTMMDGLKMLAGEISKPLFNALKTIMPGVNKFIGDMTSALQNGGIKEAFMNLFPKEMQGTISNIFTGASQAVDGFKSTIMSIVGVVGPIFMQIWTLIQTYIGDIKGIFEGSGNVGESFGRIFETAKSIIMPILTDIVAFVKEKLAMLQKFWDENGAQIIQAVKNFWAIISVIFKVLAPVILFIVKSLWDSVKGVISGALKIIMGLIKVFAGLLTGDFGKMWEGIKNIFSGALQVIWNLVSLMAVGKIVTLIKTGVKAMITHFQLLWTTGKSIFKNLFDDIVRSVVGGISNVGKFVMNGVRGVIGYFKNMGSQANTIFSMLRQFGEGVFRALWNTIKSVAMNIFSTVRSAFTNAKTSAVNAFNTMKTAIGTAIRGAYTKVKGTVDDILGALKGMGKKALGFGADLILGLINGITQKAKDAISKAKEVASNIIDGVKGVFDIHSPSKVMAAIGKNVVEGLANGISQNTKLASNVANKLRDAVVPKFAGVIAITKADLARLNSILASANKAATKENSGIHKTASAERAKIAADAARKIADIERKAHGQKKGMTTAQRIQINNIERNAAEARTKITAKERADVAKNEKALASDRLAALTDYINRRKQLGTMSIEREVEYWKAAQGKFKKGTSERLQAEINYKNAKAELDKETYNREISYIENRVKHNKMSKVEELKAYENVAKRYKKGTEERNAAEQKIYDIKREVYDKLKDINDEYLKNVRETNKKLHDGEVQAEDEYHKKVVDINEKAKQSLIDAKSDYKSKVIDANKRLADSERSLTETYQKAVEDRTNSLRDFTGIFDEVTRKQISGDGLVTNLDSQVKALEDYTANMRSLASKGVDSGLLDELGKAGPKAVDEIAALNSLSADQLQKYADLWRQKGALARTQAVSETEGLRLDTEVQIASLRANTAIELSGLHADYIAQCTKIRTDATAQIALAKQEWVSTVASLRTQANAEMAQYQIDLAKQIDDVAKGTKGQFDVMAASMPEIGKNAMQGLMDGLKSMEVPLMSKARAIANAVAATMKKALDIHSPSKVMESLGKFTGQGFIDGMSGTIKMVEKVASNLAAAAMPAIDTPSMAMPAMSSIPAMKNTLNIDYGKIASLGGNGDITGPITVTVQADDLNKVSDVIRVFDDLRIAKRRK